MRRLLLAAVGSVLVAIASVGATGHAVAAQDSVFAGTWTSIDTDGSNQTLRITGSGQGSFSVFYFDDSATSACGGAPAQLVGTGDADGDVLVTVGTIVCRPGGNFLRFRISVGYEYSAGTDTLTDDFGVTWSRS